MRHWIEFFLGRNELKIRSRSSTVAWVQRTASARYELILYYEFRFWWLRFVVWAPVKREVVQALTDELSEPAEARIAR